MGHIDTGLLSGLRDDGYLSGRRHPRLPLTIWNYTSRCQYAAHWTPETLACRGLVTDDADCVVARAFPKFFNLDELERIGLAIPDEPFTVTEKIDGSLIVAFRYQNEIVTATRGSFESDQAARARSILCGRTGESRVLSSFAPGQTYLWEIIYPENRIVVDYGDREELVFLASFDAGSGHEIGLNPLPSHFREAPCYDGVTDFAALSAMDAGNREGFVVRWASGLRAKVKFDEYKRLHRLLTEVSTKAIWETLRDGDNIDGLLDRVPDEFYRWVSTTIRDLTADRDSIVEECRSFVGGIRCADRKGQAGEILAWCENRPGFSAICFHLLDGRDPSAAAWRLVRPEYARPFREDDDTWLL
jgi:RNA ligase